MLSLMLAASFMCGEFAVENKMPTVFVVVNKMPAVPQPTPDRTPPPRPELSPTAVPGQCEIRWNPRTRRWETVCPAR